MSRLDPQAARREGDSRLAGPVTARAMDLLVELFGARARPGVRMAVESPRAAVPAEHIEAVCDVFVPQVLAGTRRVLS